MIHGYISLRVNVPWFFTKTGIFPLCSDNYLRWKIRSKKSIWIMQNDFLVNTQWSQGNSRTCCQDRGEKQEKKGKWKISVSLWFFGNIIDQMASPGHFMWKIRYPEGTWLEKDFFLQRRDPHGWSSEVNQQFGGFYCAQVLRGSTGRFWIFLFKISNINDKSCPGWPGLTPQRAIHTPENPRFASSCWGRFKNCFFKVEFFSVFNS